MNEIAKMWDKRYSDIDYAYGISPNIFFKDTLEQYQLGGTILLPAEGEGRNAVFAAQKGLNVTAFDISKQGQKKALQLAEKEMVHIDYEVGNLFDLNLIHKKYKTVALIYAHFPPDILSKYHKKIANLVEDNGIVVLEGFSKNHLPLRIKNPKIGGPGKIEMLFSEASIRNDFQDFKFLKLEEVEIELNEGKFHNGLGKVIRFIGKKIKVKQ